MRVDLYTLIHKAQRFHMFRLSDDIGRADLADEGATTRICNELHSIIARLRDHAQNEEAYIHPLYDKSGAGANALDAGHQALESGLEKLERLINERVWEEIYPAYTRFLGMYLIHLDEEEQAQRDVLWQHYTDQELAAVFNRFKAERPPALAKSDLEFMLPALSVTEITRMFQGIKASAPAPAFQGACALATHVLGPSTWERVVANI
jgi:hypothetical protein